MQLKGKNIQHTQIGFELDERGGGWKEIFYTLEYFTRRIIFFVE